MRRIFLFCLLWASVAHAQTKWPTDLLLSPEKSNFVKTSTYQEVIDFLQAIQRQSKHVTLMSMGKSPEGRDIPVAVLSNPSVNSAQEAKASGKVIVYIQGNIHAGEVEGKETVMMLMRDILLGDKTYLLEHQIILFAPIYNTDSNDKMEKGRRPSQEDSPLEVGIRENSMGLDLNRDGVKMEAHETNALFTSIIVPWDPHLFVDLHTTNGTWHAWNLTWAPSYHSAGEISTYQYTVDKMLKPITETVKRKYDLNFGPFGDYDVREAWPPKNFYTYNHHPRYLVNQFGLRNRLAILSEAFAHERFYDRINSTYHFALEILEHTNSNASTIRNVTQRAEQLTVKQVVEQAGKVKKGVRFKMVPLEKLNNFATYDFIEYPKEDGTKGFYRTGKIVRFDNIDYYARFEAEVESTLPRGYVIPASLSSIAENLRKHGVIVSTLDKAKTFDGEEFQISKYEKSTRKFEGHFMARASGKYLKARKKFNKGDFVIDLAQPLGNLAFYLLEPESDDGFVTWNFLDDYLEKQGVNNKEVAYPVFKYY
jgi:hypothetical protein